jgi:DegV family protein with EDD domain
VTRIALVTDSTSNLSSELAAEQHVYITPLYVIWGEETLRDGIDLTEPEFYRRLAESREIPKTSQASPQDFATIFHKARESEQADEVICAVLSADLSGTYSSAMQAKAMVDFPVRVIDTRQIAWALGFAVLAGVAVRDAQGSPDAIELAIRAAAACQSIVFTVESLDYIHRGGRIGNARLLLGSALNIKPVLELRDGMVASVDNVRTRKRALEHLVKVAADRAAGRTIERVAVIHGAAEDEARQVLDAAAGEFQPLETHLSYACTAIAVHTGPGMLGLVVDWSA